MLKIMIVDDEQVIIDVLQAYFEKEGWRVFSSLNGADGLHLIKELTPDFVILDLMLPDILGEEICREIRKEMNTPIIMLTAKASEDDRINGIEMGADDYIIKPFSPREVVARVKGINRRLQRTEINNEKSYNNSEIIIKIDENIVFVHNEQIDLTPIEFKLLVELCKYPGRVFSRSKLLKLVQNDGYFEGYERGVDVHIKNIRKKMEENTKQPKYILTVFGLGYKFGGQADATIPTI